MSQRDNYPKVIMEDVLVDAVASGSNIIRDYFPLKIVNKRKVISESNGQKIQATRLTSKVQRIDDPNENGRIYPKSIMMEAVEALQPQINNRMVLGELDHPEDAKIHTENACILLTRLFIEGKNVMGEFEILEGMPKGKMLKALIDQGVTVSISSRGVGDMEPIMLEDREYNKVMPGFRFVTFDSVIEPSVTGTMLTVMESKQRQAAAVRKNKEPDLLKGVQEWLASH